MPLRLICVSIQTILLAVLSVPSWAASSDTGATAEAEETLRRLFNDFVEVCAAGNSFSDSGGVSGSDPLSHELFDLNPLSVPPDANGIDGIRMFEKVRPHWNQDNAVFFTGSQQISDYDFPVCGVHARRPPHLPLPYRQILSDTFPGNTWGTEIIRDRPWYKRFHGNHTWRKALMDGDRICLEVSRKYLALYRAPFCAIERRCSSTTPFSAVRYPFFKTPRPPCPTFKKLERRGRAAVSTTRRAKLRSTSILFDISRN